MKVIKSSVLLLFLFLAVNASASEFTSPLGFQFAISENWVGLNQATVSSVYKGKDSSNLGLADLFKDTKKAETILEKIRLGKLEYYLYNEVDSTAQAIIDNDAFINMLVNISDTPTKSQYGDNSKDVSDPDFLNFDADATLAALLADSDTDNSLQAQALQAGLIARSFDVAGANDPDFVNNFFAAKIEETVENPVNVPEPTTLILLGM